MKAIFKDCMLDILMWLLGIVVVVLIAAPDNSLAVKISVAGGIVVLSLFLGRALAVVLKNRENKQAENQDSKSGKMSDKQFIAEVAGTIIWFFLLVLFGKPDRPYILFMVLSLSVILITLVFLRYYRIRKLHKEKS